MYPPSAVWGKGRGGQGKEGCGPPRSHVQGSVLPQSKFLLLSFLLSVITKTLNWTKAHLESDTVPNSWHVLSVFTTGLEAAFSQRMGCISQIYLQTSYFKCEICFSLKQCCGYVCRPG